MSVTGAIMAGVGLAGSIGGAAISSNAAGNAASTQAQAAEQAAQLQYQESQNALDFQKQEWNTQQQNMAPWLNMGQGALGNLGYLMGVTPAGQTGYPTVSGTGGSTAAPTTTTGTGNPTAVGGPAEPTARAMTAGGAGAPGAPIGTAAPGTFGSLMQPYGQTFSAPTAAQMEANDPGYQERLKMGEQAMEQSAAGRGNLLTGGNAQAENQLAQGYASNEYQNYYNQSYNTYAQNYNQWAQQNANIYNRLASMSGLGQTTAQQLGQLGQGAANNVSNNLLTTGQLMGQQYNNAAAANASGIVGSANAWSNALGSSGTNLQQLMLMNQLFGNNGGGGGANPYQVLYNAQNADLGGLYSSPNPGDVSIVS